MVMHNAPFDMTVLDRAKYTLPDKILDTIIMAHALVSTWRDCDFIMPDTGGKERGNKRLKWLARLFEVPGATAGEEALDMAALTLEEQLKALDKHTVLINKKSMMWALHPAEVAPYAEADVRLTWGIYQHMIPALQKWDLMDLVRSLCEVQQRALWPAACNGFQLDRGAATGMQETGQAIIDPLIHEMRIIVGDADFNPRSWQQCLAYMQAHIDPSIKSTDKDTRAQYRDTNTFVARLDIFKQYDRLLSSYINKWLALDEDVIRVEMNINGTKTGRVSSSSKRYGNMQTTPRETSGEVSPKNLLLPPPGMQVFELDYKQLELYVMAHIVENCEDYPDDTLSRMAVDGIDMHSYTRDKAGVGEILLRPFDGDITEFLHVQGNKAVGHDAQVDAFSKIARHRAKSINFACAYGGGGRAVRKQIGVSLDDGKELAEGWRLAFPGIAWAIDEWQRRALEYRPSPDGTGRHQYIQYHMFGCIRRYDMLPTRAFDKEGRAFNPKEATARNAFNWEVQGTAGLVTLYSMERIARYIRFHRLQSRLLGSVHDSILVTLPPDDVEHVNNFVLTMEDWPTYPPLKVDVEAAPIGKAWGYKEKYSGTHK